MGDRYFSRCPYVIGDSTILKLNQKNLAKKWYSDLLFAACPLFAMTGFIGIRLLRDINGIFGITASALFIFIFSALSTSTLSSEIRAKPQFSFS